MFKRHPGEVERGEPRVEGLTVSERVYQAAKYFGSGVIIATAFIHLLAPAFDALTSPCLTGTWQVYDWAPALSMCAVFGIWIVELIAHRMGASYLRRQGLRHYDPHSEAGNEVGHSGHGTHVPSATSTPVDEEAGREQEQIEEEAAETPKLVDVEEGLPVKKAHSHGHGHSHGLAYRGDEDEVISEGALAHILGVAILEFGVIFHSFIIGLTLAVNADFVPLFCVLIFHQCFEGIGLGSRLSTLPLPSKWNWGEEPFSLSPPYNPDSAVANIVSGVLDACSSGILLWAGLVECLAHDFVFDQKMVNAENSELFFSCFFVLFGAGIMALLGRWA
ncbi:SPOSA6832_00954 [Sporobolomyces salmonicolor]|uniref:SPOSA6832_00954-mRNA-1:cds n=1 Tax=Sporidiobolus salmonicolor TaxID=5005 RepID=A0A0D6EIL5_SPOSA|nr:SPOSA6832_00954 [Sporobolomyces salmonicolor]